MRTSTYTTLCDEVIDESGRWDMVIMRWTRQNRETGSLGASVNNDSGKDSLDCFNVEDDE